MSFNDQPGQGKTVSASLHTVEEQIVKTAKHSERNPSHITLVAVSKGHNSHSIRDALVCGHRVFGENRVQEAKDKWPALKDDYENVQLHLIGPLQTNKVRDAVTLFDVIETVDRPKLAAKLAHEMKAQDRHLQCFIQINTGEEPHKAGVFPKHADTLIEKCRTTYGLDVQGLMCIPPKDEEPALHFAFLREIALRNGLESLSMGMSDDFETAIELGATHIRLGSAIFGPRYSKTHAG